MAKPPLPLNNRKRATHATREVPNAGIPRVAFANMDKIGVLRRRKAKTGANSKPIYSPGAGTR